MCANEFRVMGRIAVDDASGLWATRPGTKDPIALSPLRSLHSLVPNAHTGALLLAVFASYTTSTHFYQGDVPAQTKHLDAPPVQDASAP